MSAWSTTAMQTQTVPTGLAHSNVPATKVSTVMGNTVPWHKNVEKSLIALEFLKSASGRNMKVNLLVGVLVDMILYCKMKEQYVGT